MTYRVPLTFGPPAAVRAAQAISPRAPRRRTTRPLHDVGGRGIIWMAGCRRFACYTALHLQARILWVPCPPHYCCDQSEQTLQARGLLTTTS